jgi:hypothetical protein
VVELSACSLFDREASFWLPLVMGGTVSS